MTAPTHIDNVAAERSRPGRRRDPLCDEAIFAATLALFAEEGYAGISIEGVAARAGVAKATIYRRYPNKAQLVVAAVHVGAGMTDFLPDTGDVRADLTSMLGRLADLLRGDLGPVLLAFAGDRVRYPKLDEEFKRSVIGAKRAHIRHLVASAIERGDLAADADVDVIVEVGPALLWHHALNRLPLTDDLPGRIVDVVMPRA
ncbi:MAG: TetR/AcrR family transcriptional regulator [Actinomycetota bacterium]|nr:TetR/AcrR family transcriptional regulator [Actinomycetota bacterium]